MFDIGAEELLLIVVVTIIVIGPKELPAALRVVGRFVGKMRRMSAHFRTGLDAMIREAEMEELERKWKEQNARIMAMHPQGGPPGTEQTGAYPPKPVVPAPASGQATAGLPVAEASADTVAEGASATSAIASAAAQPSVSAPVPESVKDKAG
ncbi:MAG: Sec-independent protein translocase protein TatB [Alteraurantiacibacter sp.]|nr:Sec-independent protein translocase protein TatB [Alteraurantiacibacter sp.]